MNIKWYRRLLLLLFWFLSACLFALTIYLYGTQTSLNDLADSLLQAKALPALIAAGAVYLLALLAALVILVKPARRREDKGFVVVETNDSGRVRMAIPAIEQLARQAAAGVEGVRDLKPTIVGLEDAIDVNVTATLESGVHVPTITLNLQRAIRQYVEMNCGIQVHQVLVSILSVMKPEANERRLHVPLKEKLAEHRKEAEEMPLVAPLKEETAEPVSEAEAASDPEPTKAPEPVAEPIPDEEPAAMEEPYPIRLTLGDEPQPQAEEPEPTELSEEESEERYEE